jgi:hypothetical protein
MKDADRAGDTSDSDSTESSKEKEMKDVKMQNASETTSRKYGRKREKKSTAT